MEHDRQVKKAGSVDIISDMIEEVYGGGQAGRPF